MLWEGADLSRGRFVRPCCGFVGGDLLPEGTTLTDFMQSELWANRRRLALAGQPVPGCERCYRKEVAGSRSDRMVYLRAAKNRYWTRPERKFHSETEGVSLGILTLHLGNLCNLKCRMCNANASSRIARDAVHRAWASREVPIATTGLNESGMNDWAEDVRTIETVLGNTSGLYSVQLSGGEPLTMPMVSELLERWVEIGIASRIRLAFPTNGTKLDAQIARSLASFHKVGLAFSVDGIGAAGEYLRYPTKWREVEANVARIKKLSNVIPSVAFTLSAANVFEATRVAQWAAQMAIPFRFGIVERPRYMNIEVLPMDVRAEAARQAAAGADQLGNEKDAKELRAISRILSASPAEAEPARFAEFVKFMNELDASRNQSAQDALPELIGSLGSRWVMAS